MVQPLIDNLTSPPLPEPPAIRSATEGSSAFGDHLQRAATQRAEGPTPQKTSQSAPDETNKIPAEDDNENQETAAQNLPDSATRQQAEQADGEEAARDDATITAEEPQTDETNRDVLEIDEQAQQLDEVTTLAEANGTKAKEELGELSVPTKTSPETEGKISGGDRSETTQPSKHAQGGTSPFVPREKTTPATRQTNNAETADAQADPQQDEAEAKASSAADLAANLDNGPAQEESSLPSPETSRKNVASDSPPEELSPKTPVAAKTTADRQPNEEEPQQTAASSEKSDPNGLPIQATSASAATTQTAGGESNRNNRRTRTSETAGASAAGAVEAASATITETTLTDVAAETERTATEAAKPASPENRADSIDRPAAARPSAPRGTSAASETSAEPNSTPVDRVRFVRRVARAFHVSRDRGGSVQLRLSPPELGSLRVEVVVKNGVMTARLEAETQTARTVLIDNLPALRDRLAEQEIRIEQFDVDVRDESSSQFQDPRPGDGPREGQDRESTRGSNRNPANAETAERPNDADRGSPKPGNENLNVVV